MEKKSQDEAYANFVKLFIVVVMIALPALWLVGKAIFDPKGIEPSLRRIQQYDDRNSWQYR